MEKIAIQLWKKNDIDEDEFKNILVKKVPSSLADIVSNYQVNIVDKDVQDASGLIQSSYPPSPDAIVFLKVKSFIIETKIPIYGQESFLIRILF